MSLLAEHGQADAPAAPADGREAAVPGRKDHHVVGTIVVVAIIVAMIVLTWPVQHGGRLGITLLSGHSMEPTFHTGDVVLTWKQPDYQSGEVVVYPVPDGPGAGLNVVHRVIGFRPDGTLITKGDNNHSPDPWHPTQASVLGSEIGSIAEAGLGIGLIRRPDVIALLLAAIAGACAFWLVLDVGRGRDRRRPADDEPPEDTGAPSAA
jgi:signal peptidase I